MCSKYLETIAATAPAQRCLVVFIAPAPGPLTRLCLFLFLFLLFSSSKTTNPPSSFPSNAASSDLLTSSFPNKPAEFRTKTWLPFTEKLIERKPSPSSLLHLIRAEGVVFPRNLNGNFGDESGEQDSMKRPPPPATRGGEEGSSWRRMGGRMDAWKRTSKLVILRREGGREGGRLGFRQRL